MLLYFLFVFRLDVANISTAVTSSITLGCTLHPQTPLPWQTMAFISPWKFSTPKANSPLQTCHFAKALPDPFKSKEFAYSLNYGQGLEGKIRLIKFSIELCVVFFFGRSTCLTRMMSMQCIILNFTAWLNKFDASDIHENNWKKRGLGRFWNYIKLIR